MARLTGKNLYVEWAGTELSGSQRSFDVTENQETADVTAGADDYRSFSNTVKSISATMEIVMDEYDSGGSAILALLTLGNTGTLIWGPEGTATGSPKKGFVARLVDASQGLPFDDAYTLSLEFSMAGTALAFDGVTDKF